MTKPEGTGTYFPQYNHYRDRPMTTRGRNQAPVRSPRNNGHAKIPPPENNFPDRSSRELSQAQMSLSKRWGKNLGQFEHVPLDAPPIGRQTDTGSSAGQNSSVGQASTNSEWVQIKIDEDDFPPLSV
ncbi:hypothetical protein M0R45_028832 [Rubus argutus]|uniref:Uncharacterized protein n=1 Tax=Rubus argutus TaxID=59490 RepID=A0AAW1W6B1_RUBAR